MKKEKITLDSLLSWQDVINFSLPNYCFGCEYLEKSYNKKNQLDFLVDYVRNFIGKYIREAFPDFPFDDSCFNYYFIIKKESESKNQLCLSFSNFFCDLLTSSANITVNKLHLARILSSKNPNLKEDIINELKYYKDLINDDINKCSSDSLIMGYNPDFKLSTTKEELKQTLLMKRKMIIWIIRHYDELADFIRKPLDFDIFKPLNKDKFMLVMASFALKESGILSNELVDNCCDSLNTINNYKLLVEYLNSENSEKYNVNFSSELRTGRELLITTDTIISQYDKFYVNNPELIDTYNFPSSYEEVLQLHAQETWKNIQSRKLAQKIRLNWEMIPAGNKVSLTNYPSSLRTRVISTNTDKQAKLKKDYDLVEEKMEYFSSTNPLFELTGINTFEGYSAYMYSNGVVVFEKFFKNNSKKGKSMMVPVSGEAIYIMNFQEFADLSKYTKMELIQEIHDFNNQDVKRIYHTPNGSWKNKVDKVINGPGYGNLDLEQLDVLTNELISEAKQKVKKIEE